MEEPLKGKIVGGFVSSGASKSTVYFEASLTPNS
jgi:hypothetical protein